MTSERSVAEIAAAVTDAVTDGDPELPDPVTSRFASGDHELLLFRWPRPGAERMLLVHGIGMGHAVYDRFIDRVRGEVDVIAVDLPGFGDAPEPAQALPLPATADLLAEALRAEGIGPVVAVGHSMGSQIVAELAARHPDLVDRAVLIAPTVNATERGLARQTMRMIQDSWRGGTPAVFAKGMVAYNKTGVRWFARKLGPTLGHRIEDCLPGIRRPVLVLRGSEDPMCPRGWCIRITGLLPRGELRSLPGRGHEAMIDSGDPAASLVLEWIRTA